MTKCLFSLLTAAALVGCTINATGPSDNAENPLGTQSGFCNAWAKAACNNTVVKNCNEVDQNTCIVNQASFCETLVPAGYNSKRAQDCINAVKAAYADAQLDATELDVVLRLGGDCSHLVAGPDKVGEACSQQNDCNTVNNYTCVIKAGDDSGTCEIPQIQANGEPCDGPAMVCNDAAYCDGQNCLVRKPDGKTCSYDAMCVDGDLCDMSASTDGSGTCSAKLDLRASCTDDSQCASAICLSGKCTSQVVLTVESSLCTNL